MARSHKTRLGRACKRSKDCLQKGKNQQRAWSKRKRFNQRIRRRKEKVVEAE